VSARGVVARRLSADALADIIRAVKARVKVKVTYADVWEFWLRNRT